MLCEVGLGYLQWGQSVTTLSGGEGQRLKLARELCAPSTGHTLYLLDEPSTGLHPIDVEKLHVLLSKLVGAGNTVIMVEHNTELIAAFDWVIDMEPGGGAAEGPWLQAEHQKKWQPQKNGLLESLSTNPMCIDTKKVDP